jgi:hypothetical protein
MRIITDPAKEGAVTRKVVLLLSVCLVLLMGLLPAGLSAQSYADPAFETLWQRTDKPIADGRVARSWMWGTHPLTQAISEPYAESPGGVRTVQYFDKSRMEINNPNGDRASKWFVTNGLLVREMVDGHFQIGDSSFQPSSPAQESVAGDSAAVNPNCPTYASYTYLTWTRADNRKGQSVTATLVKDGTVGDDPSKASYAGTQIAYYEESTGHNVPQVLWSMMNQSGLIYVNGRYQTGQVVDWVFAMGYPISEPYWVWCKVAGVEKDVLVQLFERRVLTYTPSNPAGWQVEMGNVGLHYYTWRYGAAAPPAPPPQNVFTGSGDSVVTFDRPAQPAIVHITGNAGSRHFAVVSYAPDGGYIDLLVNTTDPYDGIRPLDFDGEHAARFEVSATGDWKIEILPLSSAHTLWVPGAMQGADDDVVALAGGTPDLATVNGNAENRHFAIVSYSATTHYLDLLVNTTDPYQGTVMVDRNARYLVVDSEGSWSISITSR